MNIGNRHKLCFIFVTLDAAGANVSFVSWLQSLMPANVIVVPYWCAAHQIQRTATRPPRIWLCVSTACLNASRISTHIALIPRSVACEAHFYLTHPVRQYGVCECVFLSLDSGPLCVRYSQHHGLPPPPPPQTQK